jgi:ABC-type lipoprotein release transport system permease subunit
MLAVISIAVIASIYPSYRASKMKPVTAIQKD